MSGPEMRHALGMLIMLLTDACWRGHDIDGGEAQDTLERLSLIERHPATAEDVAGNSDFEVGDPFFQLSDFASLCVREANAAPQERSETEQAC